MLKIVGAALILWGSVYVGVALSFDGTRRVRQNDAFCRLLSEISRGISGMRLPILSVIAEYSDDTLESCGFLPDARARIARGEVHDVIGHAVREIEGRGHLSLDKTEIALLCAYSAESGTEDAASEVRRCEYYLSKLAESGREAAAEAPKRAKIYRTVSFAIGALCVLGLF